MAQSKNTTVSYNDEMDQIIIDEVNKSLDNKREGMRVAAERIERELKEPGVTTDKVSTRYYAIKNSYDEKGRKIEGNGKTRATTSAGGNGSRKSNGSRKPAASQTVKNTPVNENVTESEDIKFRLSKEYIMGLPREKKLEVVKDLWEVI